MQRFYGLQPSQRWTSSWCAGRGSRRRKRARTLPPDQPRRGRPGPLVILRRLLRPASPARTPRRSHRAGGRGEGCCNSSRTRMTHLPNIPLLTRRQRQRRQQSPPLSPPARLLPHRPLRRLLRRCLPCSPHLTFPGLRCRRPPRLTRRRPGSARCVRRH